MRKRIEKSLRAAYRHLLPDQFRRSKVLQTVRARLTSHDDIYDLGYFHSQLEAQAEISAPVMAASIVRDLTPRTAIDVGCGTGALLSRLRTLGCRVVGLEYSSAGIDLCRKRGLRVIKFDLERSGPEGLGSFDTAVSMEVAEHLPAECAPRFVRLLARLSDCVVFTAAQPGQGGVDHVNEQPKSYWTGLFGDSRFFEDEVLTARWKKEWAETDVSSWYRDNLIVFRKRAGTDYES